MIRDVEKCLMKKRKIELVSTLMSVINLLGCQHSNPHNSDFLDGWNQSREVLARLTNLTELVNSFNEDAKL